MNAPIFLCQWALLPQTRNLAMGMLPRQKGKRTLAGPLGGNHFIFWEIFSSSNLLWLSRLRFLMSPLCPTFSGHFQGLPGRVEVLKRLDRLRKVMPRSNHKPHKTHKTEPNHKRNPRSHHRHNSHHRSRSRRNSHSRRNGHNQHRHNKRKAVPSSQQLAQEPGHQSLDLCRIVTTSVSVFRPGVNV